MEKEKKKGWFLIFFLITAGALAFAWISGVKLFTPQLEQVPRTKLIENALWECFANGLTVAAAVEKNERDAYEILEEREEYDAFSKRNVKVIVRGRKYSEPEESCSIAVKRKEMRAFMRELPERFTLSDYNRKKWEGFTGEMAALGISAPRDDEITLNFQDCKAIKKLYERLQAFFSAAKSYDNNFD
ncbi:MAG TPA: hypothetical protein ENN55_03350, partial [Firmicutes bacterium]|nr:hypothetical protein [Bacillota bacterium]